MTKTKLRDTFDTPFNQFFHRRGQKFTIIEQVPPKDLDPEVGVMYRIRFEDGFETEAWPVEVYEECL